MASRTGDGVCLPLPELPASQQGMSTAKAGHYTAEVSNANGYMCHIRLDCDFPVPPSVLFEIFTHPDNSAAFRDIKRVGFRKVLRSEPGYKLVEVEQVGALRIMWGLERTFSTLLRVEEDARDPACLVTTFDLVRSDVLAKFQGSWQLRPVVDPQTGEVVGCRGELHQDVLPRGVPPFLSHLPLLGGLLRGASLNTIRRLVEDMKGLVERVKASGKSVGEVIDEVAAERGHAHTRTTGQPDWCGNEAVDSFRISDGSLCSDDEDDGGGGGGGSGRAGSKGGTGAPAPAGAGGKGAADAGGGGAKLAVEAKA
ncbi:MAG: hypothetical protein J3K34DRAFT_515945 [Monoraphidium minutum]|nr:MAG: hypothetical protein J3K34DRAFT_515945 [Monoraphidium minutum]